MDHRYKCKTVKLLKNNIGKNLDDTGVDDEVLDTTQRI
jgi:hypothetical protein